MKTYIYILLSFILCLICKSGFTQYLNIHQTNYNYQDTELSNRKMLVDKSGNVFIAGALGDTIHKTLAWDTHALFLMFNSNNELIKEYIFDPDTSVSGNDAAGVELLTNDSIVVMYGGYRQGLILATFDTNAGFLGINFFNDYRMSMTNRHLSFKNDTSITLLMNTLIWDSIMQEYLPQNIIFELDKYATIKMVSYKPISSGKIIQYRDHYYVVNHLVFQDSTHISISKYNQNWDEVFSDTFSTGLYAPFTSGIETINHILAKDNKLYILGDYLNPGYNMNYFVLCIDSNMLTKYWVYNNYTHNSQFPNADRTLMQFDNNGDLDITHRSAHQSVPPTLYITRLSNTGQVIWSNTYFDPANKFNTPISSGSHMLHDDQNNIYYITFYNQTNYLILKYSTSGDSLWASIDSPGIGNSYPTGFYLHENRYLYYSGSNTNLSSPPWLTNNIFYRKIELDLSLINQQKKEKAWIAFPNPNSNHYTIVLDKVQHKSQLNIYDLSGKQILQEEYYNNNLLQINTSSLENGMYIWRLKTDTGLHSGKFIKTGF